MVLFFFYEFVGMNGGGYYLFSAKLILLISERYSNLKFARWNGVSFIFIEIAKGP